MNAVVEQILGEMQDNILPKFKEYHDNVAKKARAWIENKRELLPLLKAFEHLGASVGLDGGLDIQVRIAGDKDCFVKCWKLWRSVGTRLDAVEKGATQLSQFVEIKGVQFWFFFSSTVCKRVKVGTKMVEQDIYETQCGTDLSEVDQKSLDAEVTELLPAPTEHGGNLPSPDDIPF